MAMTSETAGLKCAPEIGPSARIRTTRIAPVGMVLPRSAMATFPPASCSAMMPEPTTVATRSPVPSASAARRRARVDGGAHAVGDPAPVLVDDPLAVLLR